MRVMLYLVVSLLFLSSCFPKEKLEGTMRQGMQTLSDMHFKNTIGLIEVHKLRTGSYPNSLKDLQFLSMMDSTAFSSVQYVKLDSGYELNTVMPFPQLLDEGEKNEKVDLHYPAEFWTGLGCVKSNAK